jgi:hypothetical protein
MKKCNFEQISGFNLRVIAISFFVVIFISLSGCFEEYSENSSDQHYKNMFRGTWHAKSASASVIEDVDFIKYNIYVINPDTLSSKVKVTWFDQISCQTREGSLNNNILYIKVDDVEATFELLRNGAIEGKFKSKKQGYLKSMTKESDDTRLMCD